ncbi:alpha/beta hydrolase [Streptomyces sp. NPDC096032]|uniref:alpha/beta hydrolase n=1 Tax=Streptomyces sp. NPDC096032 TaxID=3366070 RepID=UPI003825D239
MASTLTWQQLKDLKPETLSHAADAWGAASRHADSARERIEGRMSGPLCKTQESEAAQAAIKRLKRLEDNYHYIHAESGLIRGTLDGLAAELTAQRKVLTQALDDAAALGYTVDDNGGVSYPADGKNEQTGEGYPGGTVYGEDGHFTPGSAAPSSGKHRLYQPGLGGADGKVKVPNPHYAKAREIANRISFAVLRARDADDRYSGALAKLKAAPGLAVDTNTWADLASDVDSVGASALPYIKEKLPLDKTPAERKVWWEHLTADERDEYVTAFPGLIGSLDGIPATARDDANRENLKFLIGKLEGRHDDLSKAQLDGMAGIQAKLDAGSNPPMFLLGIGDEGNGRAIVSYGNPDTAKNVSAYVPGLGTALDGDFADDTVRRAFQTAKGARKYDHSTASIVWLGYDAPGLTEVASTANADKGAPEYRSFMEGIQATNMHTDPHVTAIGHSYGSLVVGTAARQHGGIPGADDIVLLGSPGTGAQRADELNVDKGHVFSASAGNDPVSWLPGKESLLGPVQAVDSYMDEQRWFGRDPVSREFGAVRIESGDGPLPLYLSNEGPTPAHSGYFDPDRNPSAANNIAKIVAGRSDIVTTEDPR